MELSEILKGQGLEAEQIAAVEEQMGSNGLYLTGEENIELRYSKLSDQLAEAKTALAAVQGEKDGLAAKLTEATGELGALREEKEVGGWKKAAADEFGVPEDLIAGKTEEEIRSSAEKLQPYFKTPAAPVVPSDGKQPAPAKPSPEREAVHQLFGKE